MSRATFAERFEVQRYGWHGVYRADIFHRGVHVASFAGSELWLARRIRRFELEDAPLIDPAVRVVVPKRRGRRRRAEVVSLAAYRDARARKAAESKEPHGDAPA